MAKHKWESLVGKQGVTSRKWRVASLDFSRGNLPVENVSVETCHLILDSW